MDISTHQREYDDLRKAYFEMENNMNTILNQDRINASTEEGANMLLQE